MRVGDLRQIGRPRLHECREGLDQARPRYKSLACDAIAHVPCHGSGRHEQPDTGVIAGQRRAELFHDEKRFARACRTGHEEHQISDYPEKVLLFENPYQSLESRARKLLGRLPPAMGDPIRIRFVRDLSSHGPIHAGSLLRERRILLESSLARDPAEFARIFVHEFFHFVWLRLGNPRRRSYERLLQGEIAAGAKGELGWSAEWRKDALARSDRRLRTRRWREYVCESFCDSAAWIYAGAGRHPEFTLSARFRPSRRRWFERAVESDAISV